MVPFGAARCRCNTRAVEENIGAVRERLRSRISTWVVASPFQGDGVKSARNRPVTHGPRSARPRRKRSTPCCNEGGRHRDDLIIYDQGRLMDPQPRRHPAR